MWPDDIIMLTEFTGRAFLTLGRLGVWREAVLEAGLLRKQGWRNAQLL